MTQHIKPMDRKPGAKVKFKQGQFVPHNRHKYIGSLTEITYRSSWELTFMRWCDMNPSVVKWNSEGLIIPYYSQADGKHRRYYLDFIVQFQTHDGIQTLLVEIKPDGETRPPRRGKNEQRYLNALHTYQVNQDKWKHATEYAKSIGATFRVLTEYDLGIAKRKK